MTTSEKDSMEKNENEHKSKAETESKSVEETLSRSYIPKGKVGNMPIPNTMETEAQKNMEKTKKDLEKFKKDLVKKFSYVEAIGMIPAQASKKLEEEYEIQEADSQKKLIHLLVIIPEDNFKELGKIKLETIKIAKEINDKFWVHVLTPVDIWNLGLDSKSDIVEALSLSFPILDKGILGALRITAIHKSLVLQKFERYVTSYVLAGSLVRGTATDTSDVDVVVIIDDTDVKRMPRLELKEKLRSLIMGVQAQEATAMAGVKNILNIQMYLLTEFWESVKDANPVMFTFIRDGIPLYDRGAFLPWKSLLKMGKIKPSPESIDMFMSAGNRVDEMVKRRLMDILMIDIYWATIQPTQGLLMLYGKAPGNVYDTVKEIKEVFVEKEKLLEEKYFKIFEEITIKYYKGYEHGKIKEITGKEIDRLRKNVVEYNIRLKELRKQIEKRMMHKNSNEIYEEVFGMLRSLFKENSEEKIVQAFENQLVKEGRFPNRFLENLKFIVKTKKESEKETKEKPVKVSKKKKKEDKETKEKDSSSEGSQNVEKARRFGKEIVDALVEYTQRCDFMSMDKTRFILKGEKRSAEVFFLQDTFVIEGGKISKLQKGFLKESNLEELKNQILKQKNKETKIDLEALEQLKKSFGEFELLH